MEAAYRQSLTQIEILSPITLMRREQASIDFATQFIRGTKLRLAFGTIIRAGIKVYATLCN
jgi:hypothetical protein